MAVVLGKYNHEVWDTVGERSSRGLKMLGPQWGSLNSLSCLFIWRRRWKTRGVNEALRWWSLKIGQKPCSRMWPFLITTLNLQKMQQQLKLYTMHDVSGFLWKLMKRLCFASTVSWNFTDKEQKNTGLWWHREAWESKPEEFAEIME